MVLSFLPEKVHSSKCQPYKCRGNLKIRIEHFIDIRESSGAKYPIRFVSELHFGPPGFNAIKLFSFVAQEEPK
jgi:hypothetical protein